MEWKDLSDDAKGIIEWVVSPITNIKQTIEIKIGNTFHRKCPSFCGDFGKPLDDIDILVTKKLYHEILKYVTEQEDMQYEKSSDGLTFRIKDGVEI